MGRRLGLLVLLGWISAVPGRAEDIQVKLGSIVPVGSAWDLALKKLAVEWSTLSGGQVKVTSYSGGTVGDEASVIRKLKLGQLQAAALTARGMSQIYKPVLALSLPLMIRTDAELDYALGRMQSELETGIERGGQKVLFWIRLGWVYFFGRKPVITPEDLRAQKLWVWTESPDEAAVWTGLSFHIVQLATTDMLTALQSGMVDAFATIPLFAAARQWFALAPNMSEMRWAPLFGALLISDRTWQRIPPDTQTRLLASARRIGDEVREQTVQADRDAIEVMRRYGLKTFPVPQASVDRWTALAEEGYTKLVGGTLDSATVEKVKALLREYRSGTGGS